MCEAGSVVTYFNWNIPGYFENSKNNIKVLKKYIPKYASYVFVRIFLYTPHFPWLIKGY